MVEKVGLQTTNDLGFNSADPNTQLTNEFGFNDPTADAGMQGLTAFDAAYSNSIDELDAFGKPADQLIGPQVLYSPSTQKMFVNGSTFNVDDYQSALDSKKFLDRPPAKPPADIPDWQVVSPESFTNYIQKTVNPSLGILFGRNIEIGGSNLKMLGGRALQFYGFEETGQEFVNDALQELRDNQPFQREFTEIEFGDEGSNGAIDWFVANLAQQGPNILETLIVAGAGYVSGGGTLNPLSGVGNAVLSVMGKEGYKKSLMLAAKKYDKGEALTKGEKKLLREATGISAALAARNPKVMYGAAGGTQTRAQFLRDQVKRQKGAAASILKKGKQRDKIAGAVGAVTLSSQTMGIGDIYGETIEEGDPSRLKAFIGSVPYAAAELLPEFVLASRIFGVNPRKLRSKVDKDGNPLVAPKRNVLVGATDTAGRVGSGFLVGGSLEGATELAQESLLLGLTGQLGDAETTKRLINSFAAGFAVGGPIGGAANILKTKEPTDLLGGVDPEPRTTKDKVPEEPGGNSPISPNQSTQQDTEPEPVIRSRDLRRQSVVSTPTPQVAPTIPAGQQFLIDQGRQVQEQQAEANRQAFFEEEARKRQEDQAKQQNVRKRNTERRKKKETEAATDDDLRSKLNINDEKQNQKDAQIIEDLDTTQPVTQETTETTQTQDEDKTVEDFADEVRQEQQENALQRRARRRKEIAEIRAARKFASDNNVNLNSPEFLLQYGEVRAEMGEADATRFAAEQVVRDRQQAAENVVDPVKLKAQRDREAKQAAKDINDGRYKLKGGRIVGTMSDQELIAQRNRLVAKGNKRDKRENRDLEAVNNAISAADQRARATAVPAGPVVGETVTRARPPQATDDQLRTRLQEDDNAVQEQSTNEVATQEPTRRGETVRERDEQTATAETTQQGQEDQRQVENGSTVAGSAQEIQIDNQVSQEQITQPADRARENNIALYNQVKDDNFGYGPAFDELPSELQQDVLNFDNINAQNIEDIFNLYDEYNIDNNRFAQQYETYVNVFEEAETTSEKIPAIKGLVRLAYGLVGEDTSGRIYKRAINYLDNALDQTNIKDVTDIDRTNIRNSFVEFINGFAKKTATTTQTIGDVSTKVPNPWYEFSIKNNLMEIDPMTGILDQKDINLNITRLPDNVRIEQAEVKGDILKNKAPKQEDIPVDSLSYDQALEELDTFIDDSIQEFTLISSRNSKRITRIEQLWDKVRQTNPEVLTRINLNGEPRNIPIKNYFKDGKLQLKQEGSNFKVTTETAAQRQEKRKLIQEARQKEREKGRYKNYDSTTGDFFDNDGNPITGTVPIGKIKLLVNTFASRLKLKPKITVVKNAEDLRVKNPKLYNRAVAGRPNGDFGQLNAVGYSIGDEVIIFSDFAKTEQQVRFTLAHEVLGHFGFRAFMSDKKLNKVLQEIYDTDGYVKAAANRRIERGESKFEAIEEVIADNAASLDANIILRLWNAVKTFLNKLGMTFEDDLARYLVNQSRRNLFRGGYGVVSMETLTSNMRRLANESTYGRYHIETNRADLSSRLLGFLASTKNQGATNVAGVYDYLVRTKDKIKGGTVSNRLGKALEEVQTFDNLADKNEGVQAIFNLFQRATATVRELQQKYEKATEFTLSSGFDRPPSKYDSNATQEEIELAGKLLAFGNAFISQNTTEADIQNAPSLIIKEGNRFVINPEAVQELKERGILSKEQFQEGFELTLPATKERNETIEFKEDNISDRVYDIYLEQREAIAMASIDLLSANLQNIENEKQSIAHTFRELVGNEGLTTETENKTIENIIDKYIELYQEDLTQEGSTITYNETSRSRAEEFLREVNRAMHEPEKLNDWIRGEAGIDFQGEFAGIEFEDIIEGLKRLNVIFEGREQTAYKITEPIRGLYILDNKNIGTEYRAKQTLMDGYVPFKRAGTHEVVVTAVDKNGRPVAISEVYKNSLPYYQVEGQLDAQQMTDEVNEIFGDTEFEVPDIDGNEITVRFQAAFGDVRSDSPAAVDGNLAEFMANLQRFNVPLGMQKREEIIKAFTAQNDRMRKSLKKSFQPGFDTTKIVQNIAEHLETQSHAAAKAYYRFKLTSLMSKNNSDLFVGNKQKLDRLERIMLAEEEKAKAGNLDEERLLEAQRAYDSYAHMYYYSAPAGKNTVNLYSGRGLNREKKATKTLGRYNVYRAKAQELIAFYDGAKNIDVSTEDILRGPGGSLLKTATVAFQLGGSVATGMVNLVSLISHTIPYLGTYNSRNGYGGGFGMIQSSGYVFDAIKDMSDLGGSLTRDRATGLAKYAYVEKVKNDKKLQEKFNLTQDEADVLFDATRQGVLQAAQFNALVGTARGGVAKFRLGPATGTSLMRTWMSIFSYTEQLNRRATFLAAYRMQKNRLSAGRADKVTDQIKNEAEAFAIKAVNKSQGEYGMFNRPEMARGNILQYIFMYKQFVIITVQLIRNLAPKEQAAMALLLLFAGGLKGLPFGEDLLDVLDTLLQTLGVKVGPLDKEIALATEKVFPGFGQYVLRGFLDSVTGATISTRLGFGDIIPATGAFKAGADPWREASNFLGPVWSAVTQATGFATDTVRLTAESLGIKEESGITIGSLLRTIPLGGVRGVTDAAIYGMDGTITNRSGRLIKNDVSGVEIFFRALNFHPAEATRQNEIIRMNKQTADYAKTFKQNYINRYVKAKTNRDFKEVSKIMRQVREFNKDYRRTPFEITNFAASAERAYKSSILPVATRYKKFAPKNVRPEVQEMLDMYGYTADDLK